MKNPSAWIWEETLIALGISAPTNSAAQLAIEKLKNSGAVKSI